MTRVANASREVIAQTLQGAFDTAVAEIVQSRGSIPRFGNTTTMLYSPEACQRIHHWADYLRKHSSLPKHLQELAMLVTARELDCQYIWILHAGKGRKAGLSLGLVDALRDKKPLPNIEREEAAVIKYGQEFYRTHRVSQDTFQDAMQMFSVRGLVELTMLMGFYATLAFNVNAFDLDIPDHQVEPPLPM